VKNAYSTGYACGYVIKDGHDWGPDPREPYTDCAVCRDCGLKASNASITRGAYTNTNEPIPDCTVPA
jgi:hypothetical protein